MKDNDHKAGRILAIYDRFKKGYGLNKQQLAIEFNVNVRTIQRDFDEIRNYLANQFQGSTIEYDNRTKSYRMLYSDGRDVSAVEAFALIKIILESRAFNLGEMRGVIDTILSMISKHEQSRLKGLVRNELHHYAPLQHGKPLLKMLWDLGQCIIREEIIQLEYTKMNGEIGVRNVCPLSIVFSEFYFYLIAQIENSNHQEPAFFRVDRIKSFKLTGRPFTKNRFEEGTLRKRVQFMHGGDLAELKFIYRGASLEAIMDRFPTAIIKEAGDRQYIIEAEVIGNGCIMWLLSQGVDVEVLEPLSMRTQLQSRVERMNKVYSDTSLKTNISEGEMNNRVSARQFT